MLDGESKKYIHSSVKKIHRIRKKLFMVLLNLMTHSLKENVKNEQWINKALKIGKQDNRYHES